MNTNPVGIGGAGAPAAGEFAAVPLTLAELRLPTIRRLWADVAVQSNREGWPAERLMHTLLGRRIDSSVLLPLMPCCLM